MNIINNRVFMNIINNRVFMNIINNKLISKLKQEFETTQIEVKRS